MRFALRKLNRTVYVAAVVASAAIIVSIVTMGAGPEKQVAAQTSNVANSPVQTEPASGPKRLALATVSGSSAASDLIVRAEDAARKNPEKVDLWVVLGRGWVRKARETNDPGFYLNADACADIALDLAPDDKMALDLRGLVLLNQHRFEEARALASNVVDKNDDDPMAWGNLSDALLELGKTDEAADAAQHMMDLKPNLPSYSRASYLAWLRGDSAGAKQAVLAAIDSGHDGKDPEPRAWALVQASMIFWNEGDYAGADAGFDKTLEWLHDYPPALVGKARVAMARSDGTQAAKWLSDAYAASPLVETAWLLGDAREMSGDAAGAAAAFALAEKEGRGSDPRTIALMWTTHDVHAEEALVLAEKETHVRGDYGTWDTYAWALYRNHRYAEAKTAIERARKIVAKDARVSFHEGAIAIALGNVTAGKNELRAALDMNPKFDVHGAAEAQKLLASIGHS
jgi:tetratricopeptide (TPR) repeat protein